MTDDEWDADAPEYAASSKWRDPPWWTRPPPVRVRVRAAVRAAVREPVPDLQPGCRDAVARTEGTKRMSALRLSLSLICIGSAFIVGMDVAQDPRSSAEFVSARTATLSYADHDWHALSKWTDRQWHWLTDENWHASDADRADRFVPIELQSTVLEIKAATKVALLSLNAPADFCATEPGCNVAIGLLVGHSLTTGSRNVMLGDCAGTDITSGSDLVLVGPRTTAPTPQTSGFANFENAVCFWIADGRKATCPPPVACPPEPLDDKP